MGDAVFKLFAYLGINTDDYNEGLEQSEKKGANFGAGIKKAVGVVGTAIAGATTAVVGFSGKAVQAGMTFDSSMSQVAATMGVTTDEIKNLRDFAQKMGSTTAFSASQAADALNYMALAGYDADKSMAMLPNVLNLASAGSIDLATASDMVTDAQSALGLSMEQTTTMVDQMAMASSKSNTSVSQLGEAILTIGATAKSVKGGTTELNTVLGVLADNGIKGSDGGTHLRNMILSLTNPTAEASKELKKLGISVYDSEGNMRSMIDIIGDLQTKTKSMTASQKDSAIGAIFNRADMASVNALLNTSMDRYQELTGYIEKASGASEKMANTQLDNLSGDITLFKSALEGAEIALSDELTPTLRQFVQLGSDGLSKVTTAFQEGGIKGAFSAFGEWLSGALDMVVQYLPDIVEAGMSLLGAFVDGIIDNADTIIEAAEKIITMLADKLLDPERASKLLQTAINIIVKIANGLIQALPNLIPAIAKVIAELVRTLTKPENLKALIQCALQLILALAIGLVEAIPEIVKVIPEIVVNIVTALIENAPLILETLLELVGAMGMAVFYLIGSLMGMDKQEIIDNITIVFQSLGEWGSNVLQWIRNLGGKIKSGIKNFFTSAKEFFVNGIANIKEKATEGLNNVKQKFTDIFEKVKTTVKDAIEFLKGLFKFDWQLPKLKLPHFKITGKFSLDPTNLQMPKISVEWYKKAMDTPYILEGATIFGKAGDKLLGGGESGSELIVGTNKLMQMIRQATGGGRDIIVNVYGSEGQDIRELAKLVGEELKHILDDKEKVYA